MKEILEIKTKISKREESKVSSKRNVREKEIKKLRKIV